MVFMKKKKNTLSQIIAAVLLIGLGLIVGNQVGTWFRDSGANATVPFVYKILSIPIALFALFFVLAWHELGHVLAGLSVGFEFRMYTVGALMIEKEEGRLRLKWNRNLNLFGGVALCLPRTTENLIRRFMTFVAGGPLSSLLLSILAAVVFWLIPTEPFQGLNFSLSIFHLICALFSFAIFLVTIIPMQAGGFYTDGGRLLNLSKGGNQATLETVLLQASTTLMSGERPAKLSETMLLEALDLPIETPFKAYLHSMLHYHYLDCGKTDEAAEQLAKYESYLAHIPSGYQATVWLDKAYFEAYYLRNADAAKGSFAKAEIGAVITPSKVLRTEAAIALAENNPEKAMEKAQKALNALPKSMDKGSAKAEKEWLEKIINEAQNKT